MENLVVDSSVAIKWFINEPHSAEARRILNDYHAGALGFLAPDLIYAEVGNIVWKKHRFHGMVAADGRLILDTFCTYAFTLTSTAALVGDAYDLAVAHQRTVYDAMYLALSVRESCRMVTADQRLVNALGATFPNLVWIGNWP